MQLDFSPPAFDRLEEVRKQTGVDSNPEVIKRALFLYTWMHEQAQENRFIEVQNSDGSQNSRIEAKWLLRQ